MSWRHWTEPAKRPAGDPFSRILAGKSHSAFPHHASPVSRRPSTPFCLHCAAHRPGPVPALWAGVSFREAHVGRCPGGFPGSRTWSQSCAGSIPEAKGRGLQRAVRLHSNPMMNDNGHEGLLRIQERSARRVLAPWLNTTVSERTPDQSRGVWSALLMNCGTRSKDDGQDAPPSLELAISLHIWRNLGNPKCYQTNT